MPKKIFIIVFFLRTLSGFSQDTITYFNEVWEKVCCKDSASFYRIGKYNHGIYEGFVKDYFITGELQMEGEFVNGDRKGMFTWYYKSGRKMCEGAYSNGLFHLWKGWDKDGNKTVKAGIGVFSWYYSYNMNIQSQGSYRNGYRIGYWTWYNLEGKKIEDCTYDPNGTLANLNAWDDAGEKQLVINGTGRIVRYYHNGTKKFEGEWQDGQQTGEWKGYYENGKISYKGSYDEGVISGKWNYYFDNGQLRKDISFENGLSQGKVTWWHPNGQVSCTGFFDAGRQSGEWKWYNEEGVETSDNNYY